MEITTLQTVVSNINNHKISVCWTKWLFSPWNISVSVRVPSAVCLLVWMFVVFRSLHSPSVTVTKIETSRQIWIFRMPKYEKTFSKFLLEMSANEMICVNYSYDRLHNVGKISCIQLSPYGMFLCVCLILRWEERLTT